MIQDEFRHALYSYYLYNAGNYVHDPMMHGPLLYHFNALAYFLFGVSDFTARLHGVVAGVLLVLSPLLLRTRRNSGRSKHRHLNSRICLTITSELPVFLEKLELVIEPR